ncbi:MAG: NADH-quinone oxidoreductase subunit L, partial [Melioribacter sp.]|nr:NADH-quinone oxidoreductase subunit L [Melioribacter sp.]
MINYIYLAVIFPLIGFLINGLIGKKIKNEIIIGIIGSSTVGLSFIISLGAFLQTLSLPVDQRANTVELFTWLSANGLNIKFAYLVDQLSLTMSLIVTGVGFLIHVYSIGY